MMNRVNIYLFYFVLFITFRLSAQEFTFPSKAELKASIYDAWDGIAGNGYKDQYYLVFQEGLSAGTTQHLYNFQIYTGPLLHYAVLEKDTRILAELANFMDAAFLRIEKKNKESQWIDASTDSEIMLNAAQPFLLCLPVKKQTPYRKPHASTGRYCSNP
jgi:hypothetical protein